MKGKVNDMEFIEPVVTDAQRQYLVDVEQVRMIARRTRKSFLSAQAMAEEPRESVQPEKPTQPPNVPPPPPPPSSRRVCHYCYRIVREDRVACPVCRLPLQTCPRMIG